MMHTRMTTSTAKWTYAVLCGPGGCNDDRLLTLICLLGRNTNTYMKLFFFWKIMIQKPGGSLDLCRTGFCAFVLLQGGFRTFVLEALTRLKYFRNFVLHPFRFSRRWIM